MSCWTKYELELAAWLCSVSYCKSAPDMQSALRTRGWTLLLPIAEACTDTHGYLAQDQAGNKALVFRGTQSWTNLQTDLNAVPEKANGMTVHEGFWKAYSSVAALIKTALQQHPVSMVKEAPIPASAMRGGATSLLITGHSLGAALATIAAVDLSMNVFAQNLGLITFGGPRVGFSDFTNEFETRMERRYIRTVYLSDFITQVPVSPYKHVGGLLHLDAKGRELGPFRRGWIAVWTWFTGLFSTAVDLAEDGCPPDHDIPLYRQAVLNMDASWKRDI